MAEKGKSHSQPKKESGGVTDSTRLPDDSKND